MGITISYSGRLRDPAVVPELVADVTARAEAAGWRVKPMEQMIAEGRVKCRGLRGVTVYPHPECEPLHLHFDAEGHFINHTYYTLLTDPEQAAQFFAALSGAVEEVPEADEPPPAAGENKFFREGSRHVWTKTQFAGPRVHAAVCELLRHVQERYAPALEVRDDSGFYESGDYARLEGETAMIGSLIERTKAAFMTAARGGAKSTEELVARAQEEIFKPKSSPN